MHHAQTNPRRVLWGFIALHTVAWTLFGTFTHHSFRWDVYELLGWGHEWQLGYFKHPPLPAWALEAAAWATGRAHWAPYAVSQTFIGITFWAVWRLASDIAGETRALIAVVALAGIGPVTYEASMFNHNIAQMPFWALAAWSLHRALRGGAVGDWLLLGLWMGLGMLAKYEMLVLLLVLAGFALIEPRARRSVATPGPYLATGMTLLVIAPNLIWLIGHDPLAPLKYLDHRASDRFGVLGHLIHPLDFAANQLVLFGLAVVTLVALRGRLGGLLSMRPRVDRFDSAYVITVALGPFLLAITLSAITGREFRESWGIPMGSFIGLLGVIFVRPRIDDRSLRRFFAAGIAAPVMMLCWTLFSQSYYETRIVGGSSPTQFPAPEIAAEISAGWRKSTGDSRLRYVIGETIFTSMVAYHAPDRPSVYEDADPVKSPWIDESDLRRRGAVVIWRFRSNDPSPPKEYAERFPGLIVQPPLTVFRNLWSQTRPIRIGWAILPPLSD